MVKYLITGGCGFIGSHLADQLVSEGHQVIILDNLSSSSVVYLSKQATLYEASILDTQIVQKVVEKVDGIFHLAALVSVPESIKNWHKNHIVNCAGSIQLMELSKGMPFVFASSAAIYGDSVNLPQKESDQPNPLSPYSVDKLAVEMHAKNAWSLYRTPSLSFRFFNVYGPRQNASSPYSGVISKFISNLQKGSPLKIYGDGEQKRDFVYVKDVVDILTKTMSSLSKGASVYNLCTGKGTSINELIELIGKITRLAIEKEYEPKRLGEIQISLGDPSKLIQEKQLQAKTSLIDGLQKLVDASFFSEIRLL